MVGWAGGMTLTCHGVRRPFCWMAGGGGHGKVVTEGAGKRPQGNRFDSKVLARRSRGDEKLERLRPGFGVMVFLRLGSH